MILKKMFNKIEKGFICKPDSQVIIHTEINHYKPLKEYIINLNEIVDSYNQKYKRNISPENFIISREKYSRNKNNEYNEQIFHKQLNNISFSKFNNTNNNTNNNKFSTQLMRPKKPYKKKSILFNQKKTKEKYNNIKLDMSNYSETINSICLTERTLDRTKHSFLKEDNSSFININEDKSNKNTFNKINEIKIFDNKPINTFFYNKTYYNTIKDNNTSMNTTRKACRKIPLSKKYLINNAHKQYKLKKQKEINQIGLYRKRFTQILILLLEKYFKTYLLKYIYIFINKLKKYKKLQIKSIKNRKNKINIFYNTEKCLSDRNYEDKNYLTYYNDIYKTKNEKLLVLKLKNENVKNSPGRLNLSELFRNKNELWKKQKSIKRRKESKSKEKSQKNNRKIIINNIQNNNLNAIKKNISLEKKRYSNNKFYYNKSKPMLIIKKIQTQDKRINIDIKYLEQTDSKSKSPFKNLKISNINSIKLIRNTNNIFKFEKVYYNIENPNEYTFKKVKKLSSIKEEE